MQLAFLSAFFSCLCGWAFERRTRKRAKPRASTTGELFESAIPSITAAYASAARSKSRVTSMGTRGAVIDPDQNKPAEPDVDERWLKEYIAFGHTGPKGLDWWMRIHAEFEAFYARREAAEGDNNGSSDPVQ